MVGYEPGRRRECCRLVSPPLLGLCDFFLNEVEKVPCGSGQLLYKLSVGWHVHYPGGELLAECPDGTSRNLDQCYPRGHRCLLLGAQHTCTCRPKWNMTIWGSFISAQVLILYVCAVRENSPQCPLLVCVWEWKCVNLLVSCNSSCGGSCSLRPALEMCGWHWWSPWKHLIFYITEMFLSSALCFLS